MTYTLTSGRPFYKPFTYQQFFDNYVKQVHMNWTVERLQMVSDVIDYKTKLTDTEKDFVNSILKIFTQMDVDVGENWIKHFLSFHTLPEVRMAMAQALATEALHVRAYAHLNDTLGLDTSVYKEFLDIKEMSDKHCLLTTYADKLSGDARSTALKHVILGGGGEGVTLFGLFIMLLNFTRHNLMKDVGAAVGWSIKDEDVHVELHELCFSTILRENPSITIASLTAEVHNAYLSLVHFEKEFIKACFKGNEIKGLTQDKVCDYVEYTANCRLVQFGFPPLFMNNLSLKEDMMWVAETVTLIARTGMFESIPHDYSHGYKGSWLEVWGE
jgi:ribonucleoside-diphosphate reductase beta chain